MQIYFYSFFRCLSDHKFSDASSLISLLSKCARSTLNIKALFYSSIRFDLNKSPIFLSQKSAHFALFSFSLLTSLPAFCPVARESLAAAVSAATLLLRVAPEQSQKEASFLMRA